MGKDVAVLRKIGDTKSFITRAEKRHIGISEQLALLHEQQKEIETELNEARKRLADMGAEAAKELSLQQTNAVNVGSGLEDAVRMLMVAMHTCQNLPLQLAGAIAVVSNCLPPSAVVSEDAHEERQNMTVDDGPSLTEEDVPARQLDAALPPDRLVGTVAIWSVPLSGKREELDQITTDKDFVVWATTGKRFRNGPHYMSLSMVVPSMRMIRVNC